jgi:DNA-binding transcriptional LysR family regulator
MIASVQALVPAWDDVRLFLALYRRRTLAAAARDTALDPSTLSRRLAALEHRLGARLFDRTREAAELLLAAAEEMEQSHGRFERDAASFERAAEGTVRLSVPPGLAEAFVGPALVQLHRRHPGIQGFAIGIEVKDESYASEVGDTCRENGLLVSASKSPCRRIGARAGRSAKPRGPVRGNTEPRA